MLTSGRAEIRTQAIWLLNLCFRHICFMCTVFGVYYLCCNREVSAPRAFKVYLSPFWNSVKDCGHCIHGKG